jgi:hypothetical protein
VVRCRGCKTAGTVQGVQPAPHAGLNPTETERKGHDKMEGECHGHRGREMGELQRMKNGDQRSVSMGTGRLTGTARLFNSRELQIR